jgi:hypothetical protein
MDSTDNLSFIISIIIVILTTSLTIFSIFFNYDQKKPIKISRIGWLAIAISIILASMNLILKNVEENKAKIEMQKTISLQEELIAKNDELSEYLKIVHHHNKRNLDSIFHNLDSLDISIRDNIDIQLSMNKNLTYLDSFITAKRISLFNLGPFEVSLEN